MHNLKQLNLLLLIFKIAFVLVLRFGGSSIYDPNDGLVFLYLAECQLFQETHNHSHNPHVSLV